MDGRVKKRNFKARNLVNYEDLHNFRVAAWQKRHTGESWDSNEVIEL